MTHMLLIIIYLAFISLGLPDSALGAAWPSMYPELGAQVSYAGAISMTIALCTIISSLLSDRVTRCLGTGRVTTLSAGCTAISLLGFSLCREFWQLCLWSIPYGLGAGSVDACLNNYVATNYKSQHMSWLHCMWGVGATAGPAIISAALTGGLGWAAGYRRLALIQMALTAVLLLSLPLWSREREQQRQESPALTLREIIAIPGVKALMLCFFGYCALEQTAGLWAASYLTMHRGLSPDTAAALGGMFFLGITAGRGISGFISMKMKDSSVIWLGTGLIGCGIVAMLLPLGETFSIIGLGLIGLGCAPIYPCIIHSIPGIFGAHRSQAIIGVQMAGAYVGTCLMPAGFGLVAEHISVSLLPLFLLALLLLIALMHRRVGRLGSR